MFKQVLAIVALATVTGAAQAQDSTITPITTPQSCFTVVEGLAQSWENHKYASKAEADKIGEALSKLEKQCESNQLADAQKTAVELKAMVPH